MVALSLDELRKLHQKKYRRRWGLFLAEGEHLVQELERALPLNPALQESVLYVTERYRDYQTALPMREISSSAMARLSDTPSPQGVIACVPIKAVTSRHANNTLKAVYFHEIQDPGNLGTILRTLAWFGGFRCLLSPGSVDPFNSKVIRAGMGAVFHVPLEEDVTPAMLRQRLQKFACLDMAGERLSTPAFREADCYIFGNEARGVPPQLVTELQAQPFSIAGSGALESLNLASVVNMCVYELCR